MQRDQFTHPYVIQNQYMGNKRYFEKCFSGFVFIEWKSMEADGFSLPAFFKISSVEKVIESVLEWHKGE